MKKVFFTLMAVCLASGAMAVDLPKQGFGLQIGWAQPIIRLNSPDNPESAKDSLANTIRLKGFKVGLVYDASYIAGFGSTIALNYTFGLQHSKWKNENPYNDYPRARTTIMYHQIELSVDWQYKFEIAKETYLMLYVTKPASIDESSLTYDQYADLVNIMPTQLAGITTFYDNGKSEKSPIATFSFYAKDTSNAWGKNKVPSVFDIVIKPEEEVLKIEYLN